MATSLPTNVDSSYPDTSDAEKLHQQHHDAIHDYTNTHDTAVDPHADRQYADGIVGTQVTELTNHKASATAHTAMRAGLHAVVREVGGVYGTRPPVADVPNALWIGQSDATLLEAFAQWDSATGVGDTWQQVPT